MKYNKKSKYKIYNQKILNLLYLIIKKLSKNNCYIKIEIIIESNVCDNYNKCNVYIVNDHSNEVRMHGRTRYILNAHF